jgi:CRISPR/Cas system-associated exonuclease Cas4 (RecB family)
MGGAMGGAICGDVGVTSAGGILVATGLLSLLVAWLLSRTTGVHAGALVVASDVGHLKSETLRDPMLRIRGRPDYLVRERGSDRIYPMEVKPTRESATLYESDALQLTAYMILAERRYGRRFAGYGIVRYRAAEFRVPLTAERRRRCIAAAEAIRAARRAAAVHRSHELRAKCWACGVRTACDESLT